MRRRAALLVAVTATAAVVSGCASGSPGEISAAAIRVLAPAVQDVRDAAASGSYSQLRQAIDDLKRLVRQEQDAGDVSAARATAIEDAADVLLQDARALKPTPSPTTSSPTPSPTPTSESPSPTPSPTPTSQSPTPSPSESTEPTKPPNSPVVSASVGALPQHSAGTG
jgi:outer membrane biosynthesis protein TonB